MENGKETVPAAPAAKKSSDAGMLFSVIAVSLVLMLASFIPAGPLKKYRASRAELEDLRQQLDMAKQERTIEEARLQSQNEVMGLLQKRNPNFDLWSFVNTALTETKLKERANLQKYKSRSQRETMTADVDMIQLGLSGVTLQELLDFLHKLYASNNVVMVYKLDHLRLTSDNKGLECSVVLLTPAQKRAQTS